MSLFESKKRKTSYVGAYYDSPNDAVIIWERDENGKRVVRPFRAPHYFYVPDDNGPYTTIFGDKARKVEFESKDDFNDALRKFGERYESDISPLFRVLMDEYYDSEIPRVHYALLDVEVNYRTSSYDDATMMRVRRMSGSDYAGGPKWENMPMSIGDFRNLPKHEQDMYEVFDEEQQEWKSYSKSSFNSFYKFNCGFSSPENPYAEINAVTIWQSWTKKYITVALLPKRLRKKFNRAKFDKFVANISATHGLFAAPDVEIAADEAELLEAITDGIEDADIISGWNSEFFDLPYIIKRMERTKPRLVPRMCFPGCRPPREKTVERFGTPSIVYTLNGRTHLDYLDLFKKFTFEGRTSYSLGAITNDELDAPKMEHEGTLEQLFHGTFYPTIDEESISWNQIDKLRETELEKLTLKRSYLKAEMQKRDNSETGFAGLENYSYEQLEEMFMEADLDVLHCSFATFCCYNTHDVGCLVGLDEKYNFIGLVNQMAHENTVLFENMTGTVRYVETGIANRAHYVHQLIVMDKKVMTDGEKVEGALVLDPLAGLHKWIGSVDLTSLYPSVIRSMCISPERFVGQFSNGESDWRGIVAGDDENHTCVDDTGDGVTMTGAEWKETLIENGWALSAYGTIFDQSAGPGIVDETLTFWFAERKRLKKIMGEWVKKRNALAKEALFILSDEELAAYKNNDPEISAQVNEALRTGNTLKDGHIYSPEQWKLYEEYTVQIELYDLLQLTKKIQLNSCYGALLSAHFRFGRKEMGASVTACGRQITTFMMEQIGEIVSGKKVNVIKRTVVEKDGTVRNSYTTDSEYIIYGDTDSVDKDSMVRTTLGHTTIEDLFNKSSEIVIDSKTGKEYAFFDGLTSQTSDGIKIFEKPVTCVYRHRVSKARWKITDSAGKSVIVTGDHSIMIIKADGLIEVKPSHAMVGNVMVSLKSDKTETFCELLKIAEVERLGDFDDEYVYDIVMEDSSMPYFFANDILVHNSCYFLTGADNKADAIRIADNVAETVNQRFPDFMRTSFFCTPGHDTLIQAGREVVGSAGLFLDAKKKYTIKVVNLDGFDLEVPKLKSMGSEIKKADTPKVIQNFLKDLMDLILDGHAYEEVERFVNKQRGVLVRGVKNPISLGVAKQINNLDAKYAEWTRVEKAGKGRVALPGHVRAAVNYNEMAQLYAGGDAELLKAGDKGIIFYLAPNDHGIQTIAFPADYTAFPQWFVDNFQLNKRLTEEKMIDAKLQRIFDTMDWDIPTPQKSMVKSILKF